MGWDMSVDSRGFSFIPYIKCRNKFTDKYSSIEVVKMSLCKGEDMYAHWCQPITVPSVKWFGSPLAHWSPTCLLYPVNVSCQ